jgi:hypothetical protein
VIKLRFFHWKDECGLSMWAQCNHKIPCQREARGLESERREVETEAVTGVMCFEDTMSQRMHSA